MKTLLKVVGLVVVVVLLGAGGFFLWAKGAAADKFAREVDVHRVDFPIPFPLTQAEIEALRRERAAAAPVAEAAPAEAEVATEGEGPEGGEALAEGEAAGEGEAPAQSESPAEAEAAPPPDPLHGVDLKAIALERASARGKHLVEARYACAECHGKDFSGGVMIDDPPIGKILGPNLTGGKGSTTAGYTPADWDRIVRHGVKRDGSPAIMPSEDMQRMSDQELSDIVAYLRTVKPVDNEVPAPVFGPVGTVLLATGKLPLSFDLIHDHDKPHVRVPPRAANTPEFGEHLAGVCTGCHRQDLSGGPVASGPPDWPPASNLTPHADGLQGWKYDDFVKLMREGVRPDGTAVKPPMSLMGPYAAQMTETELAALWSYLASAPAKPMGK